MSEDQAQQILYQMQILESYASSLDQKEAAIMNFLREAVESIEAIKGIKQNPNADSLIPVGLGTYVKANLTADSKVLIDVGAGVVIEKDHDAAINHLEARLKELQIALNNTASQKQDILMRLEQLKQQMGSILQTH